MQSDVCRARASPPAARPPAVPAAVVLAALTLCGPAAAVTPTPTSANPSPYVPTQGAGAAGQGIIMRDGGICDPIRHMGC